MSSLGVQTFVPPISADRLSMLIAAVGVLSVLILLGRSRPRAGAAAWFVCLCFVPCWVEVSVKFTFPLIVVATLLFAISLFPTVPKDLGVGDWVMLGFFAIGVVPVALGFGDVAAIMVLLTYWCAAYVLGRTLALHTGLDWIYGCAAVAFTIVAAAALVEFFFSWNPFLDIHTGNGLYSTWATIQDRGGMARAEGAFGHSIALGASVALAIPLVIASRFSFRSRTLMVLLLLGCEVVTFSRAGMICAALSVALMALFGHERLTPRVRGAAVTALVFVAVVALPTITKTYDDAGAEASNSADYRLSLTSLVNDFALIGRSPAMHTSASGEQSVGQFRSIDNALILFGLGYGLVPLLIISGLLLTAICLVASRTATAPTIALVGQLPAFVSVAMITQYQVFVWFVAGLAVCAQATRTHRLQLGRPHIHEAASQGHMHITSGRGVAIGGNG